MNIGGVLDEIVIELLQLPVSATPGPVADDDGTDEDGPGQD
ncbi:MAG: hypothetical protein ACREJG_04890 [Candidatus Rokuibacteriota bacterium]